LQETRIYEIIRIRRIPNVRGNHDYNFGRTKVEECENNKEDLLKEMITVRESLAEFKTRVSFLEKRT
jgi:hypothetical protein